MAHENGFEGGGTAEHKDFSPQNPWQEVACEDCNTVEIPDAMLEQLGEDLAHPVWRAKCSAGMRKFPAGLTYLSQLMGHDTSLAAPRAHLLLFDAPETAHSKMVNVIDKPLILATLYGQTLVGDALLFDGVGRFKLDEVTLRQAPDYQDSSYTIPFFMADRNTQGQRFVPILADQRNADQPILLQISVEFQKLHNKFIEYSYQQEIGGADNKLAAFAFARAATVRTWHNVIRNDLLGQMLIPWAEISSQIRAAVAQENSKHAFANLAHAAFRCYHSLVLRKYTFNTFGSRKMAHPIAKILKSTTNIPQVPSPALPIFERSFRVAMQTLSGKKMIDEIFNWVSGEHQSKNARAFRKWAEVWLVEWPLFFGATQNPHKNLTCFSPSFQFKAGREFIATRDFKAGYLNHVSDSDHLKVSRADVVALLTTLDETLGTQWAQQDVLIDNPPLMLALLVDGFSGGQNNGRLGPVGSAIVHSVVTSHIAAAEIAVARAIDGLNDPKAVKFANASDLPQSFDEILTYYPTS